MRVSTLAALFVLLPSLAVAQSLGDQDNSGRFDGMPPGTDRYRDDSGGGSFSIPLEGSPGDKVIEPQGASAVCVNPSKSSRKVLPAVRNKKACQSAK
jgi:hypothetical protein